MLKNLSNWIFEAFAVVILGVIYYWIQKAQVEEESDG